MVIVVKYNFHEDSKYHQQVFLDKCLYNKCYDMIRLIYLNQLMLTKPMIGVSALFAIASTFLR